MHSNTMVPEGKVKTGIPLKRKEFLPFHQPLLDKEERDEVVDTLDSGWLTTGKKTHYFESEFQRYTKARFAIGVNSCTAGLHLALVVSGISKGDEVITSPITFPATANVIIHQGGTPIFADVDISNFNIDPGSIESKITPKTKAIIPVHFAGHPAEMDTIIELANRFKLYVIEDAAHAIEAWYKDKKIGSIGDFTAFSFYATKNITTGEGGMLTTNHERFAETIRVMSLHGITKDAWKRYGTEGFQHWETYYPGYKYNMFDIQASIGIHQLKKVDEFLKIRDRYFSIYNEAFKSQEAVILPEERVYVRHARHLYVILLKLEMLTCSKDRILDEIQRYNVGLGVHFRCLHLQPYYISAFGYKRGMFLNAEKVSDSIISLPLYPKMREEDVFYVAEVVNHVINSFKR